MQTKERVESVEIFAGTSWQAGVLVSILESENIRALLKNDFLGTIVPWWAAPGGAEAVKVVVSDRDLERSKLIVGEYEKNLKPK